MSEPRYIEVNEVKKAIEESWDECLGAYDSHEIIMNDLWVIDKVPTADVVKVVRCKDCDNWTDENGREGLCQVWSDFENAHYRYTPKDGYCSEGERREE